MCKLNRIVLATLFLSAQYAIAAGNADVIFYGGDIVTMNKAQPAAEAVAVQGGNTIQVNETWVNGQQVFKKN